MAGGELQTTAAAGLSRPRTAGSSLASLAPDIRITSLANGDLLQWNSTTIGWENKTLSGAGVMAHDGSVAFSGEVDFGNNNIVGLGDVTFRTGALGGTLRTGTSAADKFTLQAYDVNDTTYRTVIELDAGNDVVLQLRADYLEIDDDTDGTKKVRWALSGATTATKTTLTFAQTADRVITFPDATGTVSLTGHVHATSDITSGTFADALVAASNVTQHAAAVFAGGIRTGTTPPGSPSAGMQYYDTNDETVYTYDATRGHWFGPLEWTNFNRNAVVSDGEDLRSGGDAMTTIGARGFCVPYDSTVVGMACRVNDSTAFTGSFELEYGATATGVTVAFSSSVQENDMTLDYDLGTAEGLGVTVNITSGAPSNATCRVYHRRRKT